MNAIGIYLIQLLVTISISLSAVFYFRPSLRKVLEDLCGTQDRAQFWLVFSSILLVGLPIIFGLGYNPLESEPSMLFYDAARQIRVNLLGFLLAMISIGSAVSFFALVAPRSVSK